MNGYWYNGPNYVTSTYVTPTVVVAPVPVVTRYLIPDEYAGTPAGYVITYGGATYLTDEYGTMAPYSAPVDGQ